MQFGEAFCVAKQRSCGFVALRTNCGQSNEVQFLSVLIGSGFQRAMGHRTGICRSRLGRNHKMTEEQFTAFCILLAAVSLPSVSLLWVMAWELWRYAKRAQQ